jgi:hypothetical protein
MRNGALKVRFGLAPRPNERELRAANRKLARLPASELIQIAQRAGILTLAGDLTAYYRPSKAPLRGVTRSRKARKRAAPK